MLEATFSRDDILFYQGRAEGLEEGRAEGLEEGRAEGIEEGEAKGRVNTIRDFFRNGGTEDSARMLLNATDEQIRLAKTMLDK